MADIKQAARWMLEGKVVHRETWGGSPVRLHVCDPYSKIHDDLDRVTDFTAIELIAEDWEIVQ